MSEIITNADAIRVMTDEQLADLLTKSACYLCSHINENGWCDDKLGKGCRQGHLVYLRQKAKRASVTRITKLLEEV